MTSRLLRLILPKLVDRFFDLINQTRRKETGQILLRVDNISPPLRLALQEELLYRVIP